MDRHELTNFEILQSQLNRFESRITKSLSQYESRSQNLGRGYLKAIHAACLSLILSREKLETIRYLQLGLDLGVANFISSLELKKEFPIVYDGQKYDYASKKSRNYVGPTDWKRLFYLAVILRQVDTAAFLTDKISTDNLREAEITSDDVDFYHVDFLKGLTDKTVDIGSLLSRVMTATDPDRLPERRHNYVLDIVVPELTTYIHFLSNDEAEFNRTLLEAVTYHKQFWTTASSTSDYDPEGWISLPLLAVSVLAAYNKELRITIKSDYIPKWLIDWDWEH